MPLYRGSRCPLLNSTSAPFVPTDIDGLVVWLKADAGVESADGVPAVDDDFILNWLDQSGNGNHFVQDTGSSRPQLRLNSQNGLPAVNTIAPSKNLFSGTLSFNLTDGTSLYLTAKRDEVGITRRYLEDLANNLLNFFSVEPGGITFNGGNSRTYLSDDTNWKQHTVVRDGASGYSKLDGAFGFDGTDFGSDVATNLAIGTDLNTGIVGFFGELLIYNAVISKSDTLLIENYLSRWT